MFYLGHPGVWFYVSRARCRGGERCPPILAEDLLQDISGEFDLKLTVTKCIWHVGMWDVVCYVM